MFQYKPFRCAQFFGHIGTVHCAILEDVRGGSDMAQFIPKEYTSEPITIRIEKGKLEQIDQTAACFSVSRSAFINQCIDFALANMVEPSKEKDQP